MRQFIVCITLAFAVVNLIGCKDDDSSTSSGQLPSGPLKGSVIIFDSLGTKLSDASGVTIAMEGTSFKTTSAADGSWVLPDLPTRTYTITYSKPGVAEYRESGFQFVGGDTVYHSATILWIPISQRIQLKQVTANAGTVGFAGTLPIAQPTFTRFTLVGGVSADSLALATSTSIGTVWALDIEFGSASTPNGFGVGLIPLADLKNAGFRSGQRLYAAMHIVGLGAGQQDYNYYLDNRTGQYVFPSAGPVSEVIGFSVP